MKKTNTATTTAMPIIQCPLCGAHGDLLRHDLRASLVYACNVCLHEWQIDPGDEPLEEIPPAADPRPTPTPPSKRSRKP